MGVLRVGVVDFVCLGGGVVVLSLCGVGLWGLDLGSVLFLFDIGYIAISYLSIFHHALFFRFPLFSLFASAYICHFSSACAPALTPNSPIPSFFSSRTAFDE